MEIYKSFAAVYDEFTAAPYDEWLLYIEKIWKNYGHTPVSVLDLACGSGKMTRLLAKKGYDTIGIDFSGELLAIARQNDDKTLYLQQNMQDFELYGAVDSIVCLCDSLNYILEYNDLCKIFKLCHKYLEPNGVFIFDLNTEHKYKNILADNSFCETSKNMAYIWENQYFDDEKINEYELTYFIKEKNNQYSRHSEIHSQKAYNPTQIQTALLSANFQNINIYNDLTLNPPTNTSERLFFVAQKGGSYGN